MGRFALASFTLTAHKLIWCVSRLERAEVLAGFAMSVFLLFMGFDLISHNLQHVLEGLGHEAHHEHSHQRVSPGSVDLAAL